MKVLGDFAVVFDFLESVEVVVEGESLTVGLEVLFEGIKVPVNEE